MILAKPVTASEISADGYCIDSVAAVALGVSIRTVQRFGQNGKLPRRSFTVRGGTSYLYQLDNAAIIRYTDIQAKAAATTIPISAPSPNESNQDILDAITEFQREHVTNLQLLLLQTKGLVGKELKTYLDQYSALHPEKGYSLGHFYALRKDFEQRGIVALVPKWGTKLKGTTSVPDDVYTEFKRAFMTERRPSPNSCWKLALGYAELKAQEIGGSIDTATFPSVSSFVRRLQNDVPKTAIRRARFGYENWKRTDGLNLNRDYTDILPGEVWVGDHFQSDTHVILPNGKTCRLWITGWMDFRTCKFLGWKISVDGPTTANILIAFKRAAEKYGVPSDVYIDNGKDYRSRTLQGDSDEDSATKGLFAELGITVHFAGIRKAQSKTIERMHGRIHREFDRMFRGFCGVNVSSKPEALAKEIKTHNLRTTEQFERDFDSFIQTVYNKTISNGVILNGMFPDQLWDSQIQQAFNEGKVHTVSVSALRMFCTVVYAPRQIRNGCYKDTALRIKYQPSWMATLNGTSVTMRRDDAHILIAWFFDAKTGDYLGEGESMEFTSAMARTPLAKEAVANQIKKQREFEKFTKTLATVDQMKEEEIVPRLAAAAKAFARANNYQPVHTQVTSAIQITDMDRVIAEENRRKLAGTYDISPIVPDAPKAEEYMDDLEYFEAMNA